MPANPKPPKGTAKRERRRRLKARREAWYGHTTGYADYIRSTGCCIRALHACVGHVEAASLKKANRRQPGESGVGKLIGLCSQGHLEQEGQTVAFERKYGVNLSAIARALAQAWERDSRAGSSPPRPADAGTTEKG